MSDHIHIDEYKKDLLYCAPFLIVTVKLFIRFKALSLYGLSMVISGLPPLASGMFQPQADHQINNGIF